MKAVVKSSIAGILCLVCGSVSADPMLEIQSGMKSLHQIQDDIARGVPDGSQFQVTILERIIEAFEKIPPSTLLEHDYQLALAEFALSGGDRKRIGKLIDVVESAGPAEPILSGLKAYLEGQQGKASSAFESLPPNTTENLKIVHFFALAKGTALLDSDVSKARIEFEHALLAGPGTLVEEVALRRLARIGIKQKDPGLFVRCAALYFRRYANSPFAPEFRSSFIEGIREVENPEDVARIGALVTSLPGVSNRQLIVLSVESLLAHGKITHAKLLVGRLRDSEKAADTASTDTYEMRLLEMLVDIAQGSAPETLEFLIEADQSFAKSQIKNLDELAKSIFWNLHKPLAEPSLPPPVGDTQTAKNSEEFISIDEILGRAKSINGTAEPAKAVLP